VDLLDISLELGDACICGEWWRLKENKENDEVDLLDISLELGDACICGEWWRRQRSSFFFELMLIFSIF
jgi:hypothetical protein